MSFLPVDEQLDIIKRGVEKIVPEEELAKRLTKSRDSGTPLRIKYGIDPTGIDVHLGHTVPLRKMRQFQDLGHQAVIIIGNYTALVGDPSGRDETRARLTQEQVEVNAKDYLEQVSKVIDLSDAVIVREMDDENGVELVDFTSGEVVGDPIRRTNPTGINIHAFNSKFDNRTKDYKAVIYRNGNWFGKMSFVDILELFRKITLRQLLTRDDFANRFKDMDNSKSTIYMHEMFYPVMQAYDSVMVRADIELGGTEQLYSFMLARHLQHGKMSEQIGVMSPILVGTDGSRRMGKSLDNYIGISEPPYEMMKKFMQLPDDCMRMYFELLTDLPMDEIEKLLSGHPKEAKLTLAKTIISEYSKKIVPIGIATETDTAFSITPVKRPHKSAEEAADRWQREIGGGGLPQEIPTAEIARSELTDGKIPAAVLLKQSGLCSSTSDARRSIGQGAAKLGEEKTKIESHDQLIEVTDGLLLWVGKKRFCRIELTK
jgi:tyrosyl-tRNA synthetase